MAIPVKRVSVRNENADSNYSCINRLSVSNTSIIPPKFRSPPPKPPRRRHSDQSTITSGLSVSNRRKSEALLQDSMLATVNMPDCESLPSNWIADFRDSSGSSVGHLKGNEFFSVPQANVNNKLLKKNDITHSKICNYEGSIKQCIEKSATSTCNLNVSQTFDVCRPNSEGIFLQNSCAVSRINCSYNCDINTLSHKSNVCTHSYMNLYSDSANFFKFPRTFHRRRHSDPLISNVTMSFKVPKVFSSMNSSCSECIHLPSSADYSKCQHQYFISENAHDIFTENKLLKGMNDKLWQHLCSVQAKLDGIPKSTFVGKPDAVSNLSFADLMYDVYYAQKEKEFAVENRLQALIKERDNVIKEFEEILHTLCRCFEDGDTVSDSEIDDEELKKLLKDVETTQNPSQLLYQQRILLAYLYQAKEAKQQQFSHELRLSMLEKNNALEKVKHLEEELLKWRSSNDSFYADIKKWETNLLDLLCRVITQRDTALSKVKSLQEEIHSCHLYESSHKVQKPSGDGQSNSDYESLQKLDFIQNNDNLNCTVKQKQIDLFEEEKRKKGLDSSADEVKFLKAEIKILNKKLGDEAKNRKLAEENCYRMERLVNVLRKKINGLNVGIPV